MKIIIFKFQEHSENGIKTRSAFVVYYLFIYDTDVMGIVQLFHDVTHRVGEPGLLFPPPFPSFGLVWGYRELPRISIILNSWSGVDFT